ncbi:glycosyltransferase family 2 protein [Nocardia acidivorans]|uniref:glycosyltransferase family 2 protein n=1 Tax=Nocardia acidivorans TaxID=404580 RepID=UPI000A0636B5|nr:glycosyltransferase family 2 protein [Nocardia acidivorans]
MTNSLSSASAAESVESYVRRISGGLVRTIEPSGPVFAQPIPARQRTRRRTFEPALGIRSRLAVAVGSLAWSIVIVLFWMWWMRPQHRLGLFGFVVTTVLVAYVTLLPMYFLLTVNRLRRVWPGRAVPPLRVAMVVTKAPSEPWPMVRKTLQAMLSQRYPHRFDIWLADEDPQPEVLEWTRLHGIRISTRRGVREYQRTQWPRRRRCKEGNLAWFYDNWGYRDYDVVSQLDADHVPDSGYLAAMVRPFADPAVGYVAAPSICDSNARTSWAVRGRLFHEATFHGPHQLGHNGGLSPVGIGSHYAVRTAALQSIGGLGPELAEDFSTSYLLTIAGWSSAFAIDAEAHGEGPPTFAAMLTQEFQWSRSLTTELLELMPRTLRLLPWGLRVRFGFALLYYPLSVLAAAAGVLMPAVAAVTGKSWVSINYGAFIGFIVAQGICLLSIVAVVRRSRLLRPVRAPLLSWEQALYIFAKWPFNAWGVLAAVAQRFSPRPLDFKVTPKDGAVQSMPLRLAAPYLLFASLLAAAANIGMRTGGPVGYIGLCVLGAMAYFLVSAAVVSLHAREAARLVGATRTGSVLIWRPLFAVAVAVPLISFTLGAFPVFALKEFSA